MPLLTLVPFATEHLDDAAALLAARHAINLGREPGLPEQYQHVAEARALLAGLCGVPQTAGVAALADGQMAGYLLAARVLAEPFTYPKIYRPSRLLEIDPAGYAVAPGTPVSLLRDLFARVVDGAVRAGYRACAVYVPAVEQATVHVWRSLGFGLDLTVGLRDLSPVGPVMLPPGVHIRRAGSADLETVARLVTANDHHHAGPPLFLPALPEIAMVQRTVHAPFLADKRNAAFLAEGDSGAVLALHTYTPEEPDLVRAEQAVYLQDAYVVPEARGLGLSRALLATGLAWAARPEQQRAYRQCTVAWNTANLPGARFWPAAGFRPLLRRLRRDC